MNKNLYRIVFNRALGVMQVVSELARRTTRSAGSGQVASVRRMAQLRRLPLAIWLALGQAAILPSAPAQIVADPGAPGGHRPTVLGAGNGVPVINIQTPNEAGLSHNIYGRFDVPEQGAILNNSRTDVQSQLGGWVQGNPWLATGSASVILNEINSRDPSLLRGFIEVAGERAQVIIANPAGVTCAGCGFVNASRATITTGTPVLENGSLHHYRVQGGTIQIGGQGLDARATDHTDLIARAVQVNANIWAQRLSVSTGANTISADHADVTPLTPSGDAPAFALDVGALGGMYAQKIMLVGTEHGVGVRHAGTIGAQSGELVVTVDGRLELAGGAMYAPRVAVRAESLASQGGVIEQTGGQDFIVAADHVVNHDGGRVGLAVGTAGASDQPGQQPVEGGASPVNREGGNAGPALGATRHAGTPGAPTALAAGGLTVAGLLQNLGGQILAGGDIDLVARSAFDNDGGHLGVRRLTVDGQFSNRAGELKVATGARIQASQFVNDAGRMDLGGALTLQANDASNRGGVLSYSGGDDLHLRVAGTLDNGAGGQILTNTALTVTAEVLHGQTGTLSTSQDLAIAGDVVDLSGATTRANTIRLDAGTFVHTAGQLSAASNEALRLTVRDGFDNTGGAIATNGAVHVQAGTLVNAGGTIRAAGGGGQFDIRASLENAGGTLASSGAMTVNAGALHNRGGKVLTAGQSALSVSVAGLLDNDAQGLIAAAGDVRLASDTFSNRQGVIAHEGTGSLHIDNRAVLGQGGAISTHGHLHIKGDLVALDGAITQGRTIELDAGSMTHVEGELRATGDAPLMVRVRDDLDNMRGSIATNSSLALDTATLRNRDGAIEAAGAGITAITVEKQFDNQGGTLVSAGDMALLAGDFSNHGGKVLAAEQSALVVAVGQTLDNGEQGLLAAGGDLDVSAVLLNNEAGRIEHAGQGTLSLHIDELRGKSGDIVSNGTLAINGDRIDLSQASTHAQAIRVKAGSIVHRGGQLAASGTESLSIRSDGILDNTGGRIAANGALQVHSGMLANQDGQIAAAGDAGTRIEVDRLLDNQRGAVVANGDLIVTAAAMSNRDGEVSHAGEGSLTLAVGMLDGQSGKLLSQGALRLKGDATDLSAALTQARSIDMAVTSLEHRAGNLVALGDDALTMHVQERLDNTGGSIATNGALDLHARMLANRDGKVVIGGQGGAKLVVREGFDNAEGALASAGDIVLQAGSVLNQGGSIIAAEHSALSATVDQALDNSAKGTLAAGGDLSVQALSLNNSGGRIEHSGSGNLRVSAQTVHGGAGVIVSEGSLSLSADRVGLSGATTQARAIAIDAGSIDHTGGSLSARGEDVLILHARGILDNTGGHIATNGSFDLQGQSILNRGGSLTAAGDEATCIVAGNVFDNRDGKLSASADMHVGAASLVNTGGRIEHAAGGTLTMLVDNLEGQAGTLVSLGAVQIAGEQIDLDDATTQADGIRIDAGRLSHRAGKLAATGSDALTLGVQGELDNTGGTMVASGALALQVGSLFNEKGQIEALGDAESTLAITHDFKNSDGKLIAAGDMTVSAATLENRRGAFGHRGSGKLTVDADSIQGQAGTIVSDGHLSLTGEELDLSEATTQAKSISLHATSLAHVKGKLSATGDGPLSLRVARRLDNTEGAIGTNGALALESESLINRDGEIIAKGAASTSIVARGALDNCAGLLAVAGDVSIDAAALDNRAGSIEHAGQGRAAISSNVMTGQKGSIASNGLLALSGESLDLSKADTQARQIVLNVGSLAHVGGSLIATGADTLVANVRDLLENTEGTIATNGAMAITAGTFVNERGEVKSSGAEGVMIVIANTLDNSAGALVANGDVDLTAGDLLNRQGKVVAAKQSDLIVSVRRVLDNSDQGILAAGGRAALAAGTLNNQNGAIEHSGAGELAIKVSRLDGRAGTIVSNGSLVMSGKLIDLSDATTEVVGARIDADTLDHAGGTLVATGSQALTINASEVDNAGGVIATNGALELHARKFLNRAGSVSVAGERAATVLVGESLDNEGGKLAFAGDGVIEAQALSNRAGTISAAGNASLSIATSAALDNSAKGKVSSGGQMTISAGTLDNSAGLIQHTGDGQLALSAKRVDGRNGTILSEGNANFDLGDADLSGATTQAKVVSIDASQITHIGGQMLATGGETLRVSATNEVDNSGGKILGRGGLDLQAHGTNNTGGTIAAKGDMSIISTSLINLDGLIEHAGTGRLAVHAGLLDGQRGTVSSNGTLSLSGTEVNLDSALTQARAVNVDADTLSNAKGKLIATGADKLAINVRDVVNNADGSVIGGGALDLQAGTLLNRDGEIRAAGVNPSQLVVRGKIDNANGKLTASGDLVVTANALDNQKGAIQHAGEGRMQVTASTIQGQHGTIASNGRLDLRGGTIDLTGAATQAQAVTASAQELIHVKGSMLASGTDSLILDVREQFDNTDGVLTTAGDLTLTAGALDNQRGVVRAAEQSALIVKVEGVLANGDGGELSGGQEMAVEAVTLDNSGGSIQHAGQGTLSLTATDLRGRSGTIASNGMLVLKGKVVDLTDAATQAQTIDADTETLIHTGGRLLALSTAGSRISARGSISNDGGTIATNGAWDIRAGSLGNQGGKIQAAGSASTQVVVAQTINNAQGELAAGGALSVDTGDLSNQGGTVRSANGAGMRIRMSGHLDNRAGGKIASDDTTQVTAGSIDNRDGAMNAVSSLDVQSSGHLDNRGGKLIAKQETKILADTLDNRANGLALSLDGGLRIATQGRSDNAGGVIQASGDVTLTSSGFGNAAGNVSGAAVQLDAGSSELDNAGGTLASTTGNLSVASGKLVNSGGLLQAKADMQIDTRGHALDNRHSGDQGGILSGGYMTLAAGDLDNVAGIIQSAVSANVVLSGGFDNTAGLMAAEDALSMTVAQIINRDTNGPTGQPARGLQGARIELKAAHVDNTRGLIAADRHIGINGSGGARDLHNVQGTITSGGTAHIAAARVNNSGGTLIAGSELVATVGYLSGDGRLLSHDVLNIVTQDPFVNDGEISVNGRASIGTAGHFTNRGVIQAADLHVHGQSIDNTATGKIKGTRTRVAAAGGLSNRGLIDGSETRVDAGNLDNVGTGRIYGDHLAIQAGDLSNREEAGSAAVIAARQRLDIGAQKINNREKSLIFSAGTGSSAMHIGGSLDANGHATGSAAEIVNDSATIESLGDLNIDSNRLLNRNLHFRTEMVLAKGPVHTEYIDPKESGTTRINIEDLIYVPMGPKSKGFHRWETKDTNEHIYDYRHYHLTQIVYESQVVSSEPGLIRAGGNLTARGHELVNDKSRIVVGGTLQGDTGNLKNISAQGERRTHESGESFYTWSYAGDKRRLPSDTATDGERTFKRVNGDTKRKWGYEKKHEPADVVETIDLSVYPLVEYGSGSGTGFNVDGRSSSAPVDVGIGRAEGGARLRQGIIEVQASLQDVDAVQGARGQAVEQAAGVDDAHGRRVSEVSGPTARDGRDVRGGQAGIDADGSRLPVDGDNGPRPVQVRDVVDQKSADALSRPAVEAINASGTSGAGTAERLGSPATPAAAAMDGPAAVRTLESTSPVSSRVMKQSGAATVGSPDAHQERKILGASAPGARHLPDSEHRAGGVSDSAGRRPAVVRTMNVIAEIPVNSLFRVRPDAVGHVVEVDPDFTDHGKWLSSDYLLERLRNNPDLVQKRLGDGFYEQMLVRDQIGRLTGRRFLGTHVDDEKQYRALMEAGAVFAEHWGLLPGVSLNAEQMAQLTSDIVWLVEREVVLADGTRTRVLMPQVYVRVQPGDLDGNGTLLSADKIDLDLKGDLVNSGTIAGRSAVRLTGENLRNLDGRITGGKVLLDARRDVDNLGGTVEAVQSMMMRAGRDINVVTTTRDGANKVGLSDYSHTNIDRVAGLYVTNPGGTLIAMAGDDVNVIGAEIANAGNGGYTAVVAGRDINLGTVQVAEQSNYVRDANNYSKKGRTLDVGSSIRTEGDVRLHAARDLTARAVNITSENGAVSVSAARDIDIAAGEATTNQSGASREKKRRTFGSKTKIERHSMFDTQVVGSVISGDTVRVQGRNVTITGSNVVSDAETVVLAKQDLTIQAATEKHSESHFSKTKKSGFLGTGGAGFAFGTQMQSADQAGASTRSVASIVGSTTGDVTLGAGCQYRQMGSDVLAPEGDIDIVARQVDIAEAREKGDDRYESKFRQSGVTVSVTSPVIAGAQTGRQMAQAAQRTSDGRTQVLAAAAGGLAAKNAYDAVQADPKAAGGANITVTVGTSKSQSKSRTDYDRAVGSKVVAGGDVSIKASGAGERGDITVKGSTVKAGGDIKLDATGDINLVAAQNAAGMDRSSGSQSAGVGVTVAVSSQGTAVGPMAQVAGAKGKGKGKDLTWTHTDIDAGRRMTVASAGDTTLRGAIISGEKVTAEIRGDLNIESVQDVSTFMSKDINASASLTGGAGISGSANVGRQRIKSEFASVIRQSGVQAGDGGFQIEVRGNTDLKGGVIASSVPAAQDELNVLSTGTLTVSDVKNRAKYTASGVSIGGGFSTGGSGVGKNQKGEAATGDQVPGTTLPSTGKVSANVPVVVGASGSSSSTTPSSISSGKVLINNAAKQQLTGKTVDEVVVSLDRGAVTGVDGSNSLTPIFNEEEIKTGFEVVRTLQQEMGTFVQNRVNEHESFKAQRIFETDPDKRAQLDVEIEDAAKWLPGGAYRRIASAITVGAGGNVTGGVGQLAQGAAVSYLQSMGAEQVKSIADQMSSETARVALQGIVACTGAAASGGNCGAGALGASASVVLNNLLDRSGETQGPDLGAEEMEARNNLVTTIIAGVASMLDSGSSVADVGAGAKLESENNALFLTEFKALIAEAETCEALGTCEQVRDKYRALSQANQERLSHVCADNPEACQREFRRYLDEQDEFRAALRDADRRHLPKVIVDDLFIHHLKYNDAVAAVNEPEFARRLQEELGVDKDVAETTATVVGAAIGGLRGGKNKSTSRLAVKADATPEKHVPNAGAVGNMRTFFKTSQFGRTIEQASRKTSYIARGQGQVIYQIKKEVSDQINNNDYFHLDGLHRNHIEIYDENKKFKLALNLDGTVNQAKTRDGLKQKRRLNIK